MWAGAASANLAGTPVPASRTIRLQCALGRQAPDSCRSARGYSSVGRAPRSHPGGRGFESPCRWPTYTLRRRSGLLHSRASPPAACDEHQDTRSGEPHGYASSHPAADRQAHQCARVRRSSASHTSSRLARTPPPGPKQQQGGLWPGATSITSPRWQRSVPVDARGPRQLHQWFLVPRVRLPAPEPTVPLASPAPQPNPGSSSPHDRRRTSCSPSSPSAVADSLEPERARRVLTFRSSATSSLFLFAWARNASTPPSPHARRHDATHTSRSRFATRTDHRRAEHAASCSASSAQFLLVAAWNSASISAARRSPAWPQPPAPHFLRLHHYLTGQAQPIASPRHGTATHADPDPRRTRADHHQPATRRLGAADTSTRS